ncbi:MAG: SirB2 family protein [Steroidobacteraceae bacterium]|nr:SirB2 family protein [Steroidobacteraceae bacterium]MDW8258997.1 SirB2 family protein [Gammaproteobacteria bacterium]
MIEHYPLLRQLHIVCAIVNGALFATRGLLALRGRQRLADHAAVRYFSYANDSVLLGAALLLLATLSLAPLQTAWLALKLALVVIYIVLGSLSLRRARTRAGRQRCFIAAVLLYVAIFGIARAHDPRGWWRVFMTD